MFIYIVSYPSIICVFTDTCAATHWYSLTSECDASQGVAVPLPPVQVSGPLEHTPQHDATTATALRPSTVLQTIQASHSDTSTRESPAVRLCCIFPRKPGPQTAKQHSAGSYE